MTRFYKGFTLSELIIAIGVLGVLCVIMIPAIHNAVANKNTMLIKKAYSTTAEIVQELLSDSACYPDRTNAANNPTVGFDDPAGYPNCDEWGKNHRNEKTRSDSQRKFERLFFSKLNVDEEATQNLINAGISHRKVTTDGLAWAIMSNSVPNNFLIGIDVLLDDIDKDNTNENFGCTASKCNRVKMGIHYDGKIEFREGKDIIEAAIDINKDITE